ncbi:MAG: tetratricopeptide repeat protein [Cyanobacteria bacterium J06621_8]
MSHTIGQTEENNQQSNFSSSQTVQDSSQPKSPPLKSNPTLSDADYEFLFNQLLEGIAHGWHDQRIIKFFKRLGDRGQQPDWVNWLNRVYPKLLKLPIQSRQQLGNIMIRLGELTQAATEVNQIGGASRRIGRELLLGNRESVVWEYDGADLPVNAASSTLETDADLSERLPLDFAELSTDQPQDNLSDSADISPEEQVSETSPDLLPNEETETSPSQSEIESRIESTEIFAENAPSPPVSSSEEQSAPQWEINGNEEEFEFEQSDFISSPLQTNPAESESYPPPQPVSHQADSEDSMPAEAELPEVNEHSLAAASEVLEEQQPDEPLIMDLQDSSPVAIDMQQVMDLIQEDESLAQQISDKLNQPSQETSSEDIAPEEEQSQTELGTELTLPADANTSSELDDSNLELIESWFSLGLKQVSVGEFEQAIASWEKALNINPNLSEAWHNRGSALGRLGSYEAAVESFQNALSIDPKNYQAWNDRAHALYQLRNWTEAVASWSNAIQIMPGNHLFWYNRGCALEQLEQWQEAIASYEKALKIKPDFQPGRSRYINLVADNSRPN